MTLRAGTGTSNLQSFPVPANLQSLQQVNETDCEPKHCTTSVGAISVHTGNRIENQPRSSSIWPRSGVSAMRLSEDKYGT